ncbi:unnamed protein product [Boreogadus saida]
MDDERLVVEVEKYVELYDQSSRHYKDNSKKVIAWRAIVLEIGSSGDFLHLYCSAAVAPPPVGARGVLLTRGSIADDCCIVTFCFICSYCQLARELKERRCRHTQVISSTTVQVTPNPPAYVAQFPVQYGPPQ